MWKTTAAAQVCHCITSGGRAKFEQVNMWRKQKNVARTLAKAIMHFWHSAEILHSSGKTPGGVDEECSSEMPGSWKFNGAEAEKHQVVKFIVEQFDYHVIKMRSLSVISDKDVSN